MRGTLIACLLGLLLTAGSVQAAPPWKQEEARPAAGAGISLADAIEKVRNSTGGRVIGASQSLDRAGRPVYLVKVLLPNGVVRTMRVSSQ